MSATPSNIKESAAQAMQALEQLKTDADNAKKLGISFETFKKDCDAKIDALQKSYRKLADARAGESVGLPGCEDTAGGKGLRLVNAVRGLLTGQWDDPEQKAILEETTKKAGRGELLLKGGILDSSAATTGGYVVPSELTGPIIAALRTEQMLPRLGVQQLTNIRMNPLPLVRQTGIAAALWEGETTPLKETAAQFAQFNLTPHRCGAFTRLSTLLLDTSIEGLEELVRTDLLLALGEKVDITAFTGTGANNQPLGLFNMSGLLELELGPDGNTGGNFTVGSGLAFEGMLEDANALRGNLAYAFDPKIRRGLLNERIPQFSGQTNGEYVSLPRNDATLRTQLGYNFAASTAMPKNLTKGSATGLTGVVFANWSDFIMAWWANITIEASRVAADGSGGSAFLQDLVMIKVVAQVDFDVRRGESFCVCKDVIVPTNV